MKNICCLLFLLIFLFTYSKENITLRSLGAKGDGINDDTVAFIKAFKLAANSEINIIGENLNYKLTGSHEITLKKISLSDMRICFDDNYRNQFNIKINSNEIEVTNISIDGGRGTYNKNIENWKIFSQEANVKSIDPFPSNIFYFVAPLKSAKISINNFSAKNIHAQSCFTISTFGKAILKNLKFDNVSNKTFQVYHTFNDGIDQSGETHLENATASNIGLLPVHLLVDDKPYNSSQGKYMPQSSFNFIVTFGTFYANNINVQNYASTGLTADRNLYFKAKNIIISSTNPDIYSNNPSGALWFEACKQAYVSDAQITITSRSKLDSHFDNSAVHIYGVNSKIVINDLLVKSDLMSLNKGIRGSMQGENSVTINNLDVSGQFKSEAVLFASLDSDIKKNVISFGNVVLRNNNMVFDMMESVNINSVRGITKEENISYRLPLGIKKIGKFSLKNSNLRQVEISMLTKDISINKNTNIKKIIYK